MGVLVHASEFLFLHAYCFLNNIFCPFLSDIYGRKPQFFCMSPRRKVAFQEARRSSVSRVILLFSNFMMGFEWRKNDISSYRKRSILCKGVLLFKHPGLSDLQDLINHERCVVETALSLSAADRVGPSV